MNKISGIYKILNKVTGKFYIGSSVNIHKRWVKHLNELNSRTHCNLYLQASWNKHGKTSFEFIILEALEPDWDIIVSKEQEWLDKTACYNETIGYNFSKTALRIRTNKSLTGRKLTEEHKRKISEAGKGRTASPETRERLRIVNTGKKASEQTKDKLRQSHLGNHSRKPRFTEEQIQVFIQEVNECGKQSVVAKKYGIAFSTMNYLYKRYSA